jgi:hypothetical protein
MIFVAGVAVVDVDVVLVFAVACWDCQITSVAADAAVPVPPNGLGCAMLSVPCSGTCNRVRGTHCRLPLFMPFYCGHYL